jgi:hypothetical protein
VDFVMRSHENMRLTQAGLVKRDKHTSRRRSHSILPKRNGRHNLMKCPAMNHIPVATLWTLATRRRGFHLDLKSSIFSPTTLMLAA